jgi:TolA-binding protein
MFRVWAPVAAILALALFGTPALASGDFTCAPRWTLSHTQYTGCDSMALLGPANDTRVNLHLLLMDLHPSGTPAPEATLVEATPFSWATFEDGLSGLPARPEDDSEDVPPAASEFAKGEGTRCVSAASGAAGFEAAVATAGRLPLEDRARLSDARKAMQPTCEAGGAVLAAVTESIKPVKSAPGRAFAAYLEGAAAFYDGDFDTAGARFAGLAKSDNEWLRQSARYMLGRVEINRAQVNAFDQYGALAVPPKADATALAAAESDLKAYLRDYPTGLYAASARGLLRRVYWLGGDRTRLEAEYVWQFDQTDPHARNLSDGDLVQEIDAKLLSGPDGGGLTDPTLLAVTDLRRMRHEGIQNIASALSLHELEAQRPRFASNPGLFDYLLAAHAWFLDGRPAEVVRLIAAEPPGAKLSYLQFSRQLLRVLALEKLGDPSGRETLARLFPAAMRPYQSGALQLALAMADERRGEVDLVFEAGSPIRHPAIRDILLTHVAGPALLRRRAAATKAPEFEAQRALFILLYKELTRGDYSDFVADLNLLQPVGEDGAKHPTGAPNLAVFAWSSPRGEYPCPSLREVAERLARIPRAVQASLCVGEFTRLEGFDHSDMDNPPPTEELGGAPSRFPGGLFSRMTIYQAVIADAAAPAEARAYALYRAIYCYAPSGNSDCGGADVPVAQRKAWFHMLKSQYPSSPWAADLKVYW